MSPRRVARCAPAMPNELVDLSSVVDGYDADEDWSVDRMYDDYGTCFD